jgi:hypothetical protein
MMGLWSGQGMLHYNQVFQTKVLGLGKTNALVCDREIGYCGKYSEVKGFFVGILASWRC